MTERRAERKRFLYDIINAFIKTRKFKSFLEIGTAGGEIVIFLL